MVSCEPRGAVVFDRPASDVCVSGIVNTDRPRADGGFWTGDGDGSACPEFIRDMGRTVVIRKKHGRSRSPVVFLDAVVCDGGSHVSGSGFLCEAERAESSSSKSRVDLSFVLVDSADCSNDCLHSDSWRCERLPGTDKFRRLIDVLAARICV